MEDPVTLRCVGSDTKSFQVERHQVCAASNYLAPILSQRITPGVAICDTSDEALGLFCNWVQDPNAVVDSNEHSYMQEPWLSSTAAAWILGQKIESVGFQKFCMEIFIKNCAFCPFGPWKDIEKGARDRSPLLRFSNHWIAWNANLLEDVPQEYEGLRAVALAKNVTDDPVDPREFDQDHWYSSCGDQISPLCKHNPRA